MSVCVCVYVCVCVCVCVCLCVFKIPKVELGMIQFENISEDSFLDT